MIRWPMVWMRAGSSLAVAALILAAACTYPQPVPEDTTVPTAVGVVRSAGYGADAIHVVFEDGRELAIPADAEELSGPASPGTLLIVGEFSDEADRSGFWYAALGETLPGCYVLAANGEVRDGRMATSLGFSLPLGETWREEAVDFHRNIPGGGFCVDATGAIARMFPGTLPGS